MASTPPSRVESCLLNGALAALFSLVLLALGLAGAALGVRYGVVPGPTLHIELGSVEVIAQTNGAPNCNPRQTTCAGQGAGGSTPEYYSLWVVTSQKVATGNNPEQYGGARVFAIPVGP